MSNVELVVISFTGEDKALEVLNNLKRMEKEKELELINTAVLRKGADGRPHVFETEDVNPSQGALFGAIAGGLIGLLGGPAGAVVGAAAGAATGGAAARGIDLGFSQEFLNDLKNSLQPNTSAVLVLVNHDWAERLVAALQPQSGRLLRHALKTEVAEQLKQAGADKPGK